MKRILFPTDFSEAANNAFNVALSLAKQTKAELIILHSLNSVQQYVDISLTSAGDITMPGMQPEVIMNAIEEERKRVDQKMAKLIDSVEKMGISVLSYVIDEALENEVNNFSRTHNIGFIVMGTRGASGLREAFIGSTAQKIVRKAHVPVLTVSHNFEGFTVKNMVYCSDFSEDQINDQLPRVKQFVDFFNAQLHLVYVNTPSYFEESSVVMSRMKNVAQLYGLENSTHHIYNAFDIDDGVISFANMIEADLITMITHGYRGVKKLFSDNVTESIVNHSKFPVLTLHIH